MLITDNKVATFVDPVLNWILKHYTLHVSIQFGFNFFIMLFYLNFTSVFKFLKERLIFKGYLKQYFNRV